MDRIHKEIAASIRRRKRKEAGEAWCKVGEAKITLKNGKIIGVRSFQVPKIHRSDGGRILRAPDVEKPDMVNRPPHYTAGAVECIDGLEAALGAGFVDFCLGSAMKYLWRWRHKGGVEDLKKGRWYLERALKTLEPKR